ncbi:MAG TPA: nuclear transport factor 2 family protein [Streptosporangiaceae bacterium]|jgi:ketosteroid isomerase-like protein|nr:nuclear transport factor 2 family protein [Streptosporangiaceae bacterium]
MTSSSAPTPSPAETVQAFLDAFARRDVAAAMAVVDPRVSVTVHPLGIRDAGSGALQTVLADMIRAFPDLLVRVDRVITTGDVVTALLKVDGTQAADYAGAINQEKHLDIDQAWRLAVHDGVITGVTAYWCQQQLYRRLAVKRFDAIAIA